MYNLDAELPRRIVHGIVSLYCDGDRLEYMDLCK